WRRRSRIVACRLASTVSTVALPWASVLTTPTCILARAGRYLPTGSERKSLPSSMSIMTAMQAMGFVMDASEKIASPSIGLVRRIAIANGLEVGEPAFASYRYHRAGQAAFIDVSLEHRRDALQALGRKTDLFGSALRKRIGERGRRGQ